MPLAEDTHILTLTNIFGKIISINQVHAGLSGLTMTVMNGWLEWITNIKIKGKETWIYTQYCQWLLLHNTFYKFLK